MNTILFSTNERGPDHGPVYFMKTTHSKATEVPRADYLAMLDYPGEWREGDYYATVSQTAQDGAGRTEARRVVLVHHIDGEEETDAEWLARQGELEDYRQTVGGMSYRGQ
jgi:hypothetical protein